MRINLKIKSILENKMSARFVTLFNNTLSQFVDDLLRLYPEDKDFREFKTGIMLVTNLREDQLIRLFIAGMRPEYKAALREHDADGIKRESYELSKHPDNKNNKVEQIVEKVYTYWERLDAINRDMIWKYVDTILIIIDKYEAAQ
jgi:hypothetical protein